MHFLLCKCMNWIIIACLYAYCLYYKFICVDVKKKSSFLQFPKNNINLNLVHISPRKSTLYVIWFQSKKKKRMKFLQNMFNCFPSKVRNFTETKIDGFSKRLVHISRVWFTVKFHFYLFFQTFQMNWNNEK